MSTSHQSNTEAASGGATAVAAESGTQQSHSSQTVSFERTFCHYIDNLTETGVTYTPVDPDPEKNNYQMKARWEDGWVIVPYDIIPAAIRRRDWFWINQAAKRWRIVSAGFKMDHMISISSEIGTSAGAIKENTTFNEQPFCWTYVDTEYQLPFHTEGDKVPNILMSAPWTNNRQEMTLKPFIGTWTCASEEPGVMVPAYNQHTIMNLLNTNLCNTFRSGETFEFQWHATPRDKRFWRHCQGTFGRGVNWNDQTPGKPIPHMAGMWATISGELMDTGNDMTKFDNYHHQSMIKQFWEHPPPKAIIKTVPLRKKDNSLLDVSFFVQCTYNITIELDSNQMMYREIQYDEDLEEFLVNNAAGCNPIKMTMGPLEELSDKDKQPIEAKIAKRELNRAIVREATSKGYTSKETLKRMPNLRTK